VKYFLRIKIGLVDSLLPETSTDVSAAAVSLTKELLEAHASKLPSFLASRRLSFRCVLPFPHVSYAVTLNFSFLFLLTSTFALFILPTFLLLKAFKCVLLFLTCFRLSGLGVTSRQVKAPLDESNALALCSSARDAAPPAARGHLLLFSSCSFFIFKTFVSPSSFDLCSPF